MAIVYVARDRSEYEWACEVWSKSNTWHSGAWRVEMAPWWYRILWLYGLPCPQSFGIREEYPDVAAWRKRGVAPAVTTPEETL